jgi:hypothetical protein
MSRQKAVDAVAAAILVFFLIAIFVVPAARDWMLKMLCNAEMSRIASTVACANGLFIIYLVPFFSASWLIIRVFVKLTKFASIVDLDSRVCKSIGVVYQKVKVLDG